MIQSGWNCECKHVFLAPGSPWTSFAQQSITQCQRFMIRSKPKQGWIWTATYPPNFMVGNVPLVGSQVVCVRFTDPDCSCAWGAATQSAPKQQRLDKLELNFKPRKNSWMDLTFCQQTPGPEDLQTYIDSDPVPNSVNQLFTLHATSFMFVTVGCAKKPQWPCISSWKLVKYLSGTQRFTAEVALHQDDPNVHCCYMGAPSKLQWGPWSCCPGACIKSQQKDISCPELDLVLPGSELTVIHSSLYYRQKPLVLQPLSTPTTAHKW